MKDLLDEYFNITYQVKNNEVTKLSVKIKPEKLPKKKSTSNGATVDWYVDKFGDELGKSLYDVRKKFNSSNEIVNYLINTDISEEDKSLLLQYKNNRDRKRRESNIKTYSDPKFKSQFIEIANKKERVEKISTKSKEMWENAKKNNKKLYYRMINSSKHKNYSIDSVDMNYIEYQIAKILDKLEIKWEYEKIFNIEDHTYLPDFYCKDYNMIIECYGDFWHANPSIIGDRKYTHSNRLVEDVWEYDKKKEDMFKNNGYDFIYFWEDTIINDLKKVETQIKDKIK